VFMSVSYSTAYASYNTDDRVTVFAWAYDLCLHITLATFTSMLVFYVFSFVT